LLDTGREFYRHLTLRDFGLEIPSEKSLSYLLEEIATNSMIDLFHFPFRVSMSYEVP